MTIELIKHDNREIEFEDKEFAQVIYADMIYENENLDWIPHYWKFLSEGGLFIVQTDWHTDYLVRFQFELIGANFVNHLVWKNEWGNHPKNRFHQCYDDIIIYSKGRDYKFYPDRVQVPKATALTKLNPSGRMTKTATAWIDDITLTTTSRERVKLEDGHLIRWQKPLKLFDRIILPFTDETDYVLDPFMGSGSLGVWCKNNDRNYIGIEYDKSVFEIAEKRIKECS